jgi:hypothetical protein
VFLCWYYIDTSFKSPLNYVDYRCVCDTDTLSPLLVHCNKGLLHIMSFGARDFLEHRNVVLEITY